VNILCISASNVKNFRDKSASTKTCQIVKKICGSEMNSLKVDIIQLVDYNLKSCIMCGECEKTGQCIYDDDFNRIYSAIKDADGVFVVCPHYAPIPSKMIIILEKLEEMAYLHSCSKKDDSLYPISNKPVAIIGHGGCTGDIDKYYSKALLEPLSSAFKSVAMDVVGIDETWPDGIVFGVTGMKEA
jgi:hypothetical protein